MKKKSTAGGVRVGAGRPKGTGKYGELTQPMRVPLSLATEVKSFILSRQEEIALMASNVYPLPKRVEKRRLEGLEEIPLYNTRVAAGLPSPADDSIERYLNLNEYLVDSPSDTFCVRAIGDSMIDAGINEHDMLVVDRSLKAVNGKVIIAVLNNELTVKRLELKGTTVRLLPENPRYSAIEITEAVDFLILGVVVHVIHSL
jgi:DNA polymerase V